MLRNVLKNTLRGFDSLTFKKMSKDRYEEKFAEFVERVKRMHTDFYNVTNEKIAWHKTDKPLSESVVALGTTCGVHLKSDKPFDKYSEHGDQSYRLIPNASLSEVLMVSHNHFNHKEADKDINCVFPIDRLKELAEEGILKISDMHFGFMGFNPDPEGLIPSTDKLIQQLKEHDVDIVVMSPG